MCFGLLGADVTDEIGVGHFALAGDVRLSDEEYGAGTLDSLGDGAIRADAVGKESTPFVGKATFPNWSLGAVEELF
jgi:hypothetical protein